MKEALTVVFSIGFISYFLIPLGILLVSYQVQRNFNLRLNSATDLYVFLCALDLAFLINRDSGAPRVNPLVAGYYMQTFVLGFLISLWFLTYSARIQSRVQTYILGTAYYPIGGVSLCWIFAMGLIATHFFIVLGQRI